MWWLERRVSTPLQKSTEVRGGKLRGTFLAWSGDNSSPMLFARYDSGGAKREWRESALDEKRGCDERGDYCTLVYLLPSMLQSPLVSLTS
ncbi:hypothetical protein Tco_1276278 [Tanacetum coccineum]